jgi:CDP-diacylglycerol--glycerol-3-phosphate 3-phosphatidyltransferase
MFDGNWRGTVDRGLEPIGVTLRRAGLTADILTLTGIVMAAAAAVVIANGYLRVGLVFLILTGIPDALDGAVAKASGTTSVRGAFLDSVSDRFTDSLIFFGIIWYLADAEPGHTMMLGVAVLIGASLVSYQRAKAESLGFDAKGGIMERAERFIALGVGLLFPEILVPILWLMLGLTIITALQRFVKVWKQATAARPDLIRERRRSRRRSRPRQERTGRLQSRRRN